LFATALIVQSISAPRCAKTPNPNVRGSNPLGHGTSLHPDLFGGRAAPTAAVPGQHHVRMNMYIAQVKKGQFEVVKNLGAIDPKERVLENV